MKAHETAARRDVVMPLWTEAALAQLSLPERAQVAAALRRFVEAEHPGPGDSTIVVRETMPGEQKLYALQTGADLRILLLQRDDARHYEVVGISRHPAQ